MKKAFARSSILLTALFLFNTATLAKKKTVIGRIEKVQFPDLGLTLESRIDTGARTCSLHVVNERVFDQNGDTYIEFDTEDQNGNKTRIRTKVYRVSNVKNTTGDVTSRYVIRAKVKLGKVTRTVNINLNDRTELKYSFLVGRNFLRGRFLVDVALSHTQE